MLKFYNRLLFEKGLKNKYIFEDIEQKKCINKWLHICIENCYEVLKNFTNKIIIKETMYKAGYFLFSKEMLLYEIKDILVTGYIEIVFVCFRHKTSSCLQHYQSFSSLDVENIYMSLHLSYFSNGNKYIRYKY